MPNKVPYLREEQIERDAAALLAEYEQARGVQIDPPVPDRGHRREAPEARSRVRRHAPTVRRSALRHSGLEPDILGAMFFDERRIVIDESLDPEENPSEEGRYRFTLAHEGGDIGGCIATCSPRTRRRFPVR